MESVVRFEKCLGFLTAAVLLGLVGIDQAWAVGPKASNRCGGEAGYTAVAYSPKTGEAQSGNGCFCSRSEAELAALNHCGVDCVIVGTVAGPIAFSLAVHEKHPTEFAFAWAPILKGPAEPAYIERRDGTYASRAAYIQIEAYTGDKRAAIIHARNLALSKCGVSRCHTRLSDSYGCMIDTDLFGD